MSSVKIELRAVNNKALVNNIVATTDDGIKTFGIKWEADSQREALVELIQETLMELKEEGTIEQYKVMCDRRNNTPTDFLSGMFHLDIHFKQHNCLNVTKILYTISTATKLKQANYEF